MESTDQISSEIVNSITEKTQEFIKLCSNGTVTLAVQKFCCYDDTIGVKSDSLVSNLAQKVKSLYKKGNETENESKKNKWMKVSDAVNKWENDHGQLKSFGEINIRKAHSIPNDPDHHHDAFVVEQEATFYWDPYDHDHIPPFTGQHLTITLRFASDLSIRDFQFGKSEKFSDFKPDFVIATKPPRTLRGTLTFQVEKDEDLLIMWMKPPELRHQQNFSMRTYTLTSTAENSAENSMHCELEGGASIWKSFVSTTKDSNAIFCVECQWEYSQRLLVLRDKCKEEIPESTLSLSQEEREIFLKSDSIKYNFRDERFQKWINENKLIYNPEEENLFAFGWRVLTKIHECIEYSAKNEYRGCGMGGVAQGVIDKKTDCGGMALILVAVMRSNNIPARLTQGQLCDLAPINKNVPHIASEEFDLGFHALAEIFIDGAGWLPIETTDRVGIMYGRDRSTRPFLTRHFDFVYDLEYEKEDGTKKTLHPYFMSVLYPVIFKSTERNLVYKYERQRWRPLDVSLYAEGEFE